MILFTNQELRLHIPSNAVDDVANLQGVLDNSEKDFLEDKLGSSLYNRLCEYYASMDGEDFYQDVVNGTYVQKPWSILLLNAQRMVANDAMARFAYQQILSVNGAGVNVASSNDYDAASEKLLDKGVVGFKREAMVSLNNTLMLLERWAKTVNTPALLDESGSDETDPADEIHQAIEEIVLLWQESKYYYLHHDLLIPTCSVLEQYIDIYDNRDKFIRLIPDIRYIQDEYIADVFGEELIDRLQLAEDDDRLLKKVRRLIIAHLKERTSVIAFDKTTRQQAHDETISLRDSIYRYLKAEKEEEERKLAEVSASNGGSSSGSGTDAAQGSSSQEAQGSSDNNLGFQNNQEGAKMFVSPLLF